MSFSKRDGHGARRPVASRGLSLLEVMCALVILGTILASAMFAISKCQRHLALIEKKSQALAALETMLSGEELTRMFISREPGPNSGQEARGGAGMPVMGSSGGDLPGSPGLRWASQTRTERADELEVTIARIDVHDGTDAAPLASLEIVVSAKVAATPK
jgi:prepilin-type N-terminal cleavage/methylation domain-containing protein